LLQLHVGNGVLRAQCWEPDDDEACVDEQGAGDSLRDPLCKLIALCRLSPHRESIVHITHPQPQSQLALCRISPHRESTAQMAH